MSCSCPFYGDLSHDKMHFTNAALIFFFFFFSFWKILKFRHNEGFEQRMLLSAETMISWPQYVLFFFFWISRLHAKHEKTVTTSILVCSEWSTFDLRPLYQTISVSDSGMIKLHLNVVYFNLYLVCMLKFGCLTRAQRKTASHHQCFRCAVHITSDLPLYQYFFFSNG